MARRISVELLIIAGIGLVLGLLGPFGTYPMPLAPRLAYWVGFIVLGYLIFRPVTRAASWLHEMSSLPLLLTLGLAVAVASLPLAFLIGFAINGMQLTGPMLQEKFGVLYLQCAGIGMAIYLVMRQLFSSSDSDNAIALPYGHAAFTAPPTSPPEAQKVKLHDRLPEGFPEEISALSVEDHYVRVHAENRSEMLLMRLRDAIAEMDGMKGTQVHRGWWVAEQSVVRSRRKDRNWRLILNHGLEAPVARSHVGRLKQMGWIK